MTVFMTTSTRHLSLTAFFTLLLIALMMGANHVAARIAGPRLQQGFAGAMLVVAVAMAWPLLG